MAINNQINNNAASPAQVQDYAFNIGVDSGAANAYVVAISPAPIALFDGLTIQFTPLNNNTISNPTLDLNGLGAVQIYNPGFQSLYAGDINTNGQQSIVQCIPDGIGGFLWMLLNPQQFFANTKSIAGNNYAFGSDSGSANAYNFVPNSGFTGVSVQMGCTITDIPSTGLTNTSSSCTMAYNGNFSSTVRLEQDAALVANDIVANNSRPYDFEYGRTASGLLGWILKNPATGKLTINVQTLSGSGTYTPTPGTQHIEVEMCGGGGGTGGTTSAIGAVAVSAPGTAGGYLKFAMTKVQIGASLAFSVGAAGTAGAGTTSPTAGGNGGSTTFGSWTAAGGNGSAAGAAATTRPGATGSAANTVGTGFVMQNLRSSNAFANSGLVGTVFFINAAGGNRNPLSSNTDSLSNVIQFSSTGSGTGAGSGGGSSSTGFGWSSGSSYCYAQASAAAAGSNVGSVGGIGTIVVKEYIYR